MDKPMILVVDDDPDLLQMIEMRLGSAGYRVLTAASGEEALERFRAVRPRAVVTDLRMGGMDGHMLFERLHAEAPSLPVIILTAHGSIPEAVRATQRGVFSFLTKPFDGRELLALVADAVAVSPPLSDGVMNCTADMALVSSSVVMDELQRQAGRAAAAEESILISGPRGAGKEQLARAIHSASRRAGLPFVAVRCSEVEDGAFAAEIKRAGAGILFLDDVDVLPPALQARLLPLVMQPGMFGLSPRPQGGARPMVIAATSHALDQLARVGRFRSDLFYALSGISLAVPSLEERREDIPLLVAHFAAGFSGNAAGEVRGFAPEALTALQSGSWPGNVRQLRNVVEQALTLAVTPLVPATLVARLQREENESETSAFDEARRAFEYDYLVELLKTTGGNVARAARVAQRNRTEFYKLLARHELDPASFKMGGR